METPKLQERVLLARIHPNQKKGMLAIAFEEQHSKEELLEILEIASRRYICRQLDLILYHPTQIIEEAELQAKAAELSQASRRLIAVSLLTGAEDVFLSKAVAAQEMIDQSAEKDFLHGREKLVAARSKDRK